MGKLIGLFSSSSPFMRIVMENQEYKILIEVSYKSNLEMLYSQLSSEKQYSELKDWLQVNHDFDFWNDGIFD